MTAFYSEALGKHDRSAFTSGNERIDAYFRQTVSQDVKRGYAACYVLVEKASTKLAGFYTLSSHSIPLTELAPDVVRKLPRYPSVPAVLIGWLGRDASFAAGMSARCCWPTPSTTRLRPSTASTSSSPS